MLFPAKHQGMKTTFVLLVTLLISNYCMGQDFHTKLPKTQKSMAAMLEEMDHAPDSSLYFRKLVEAVSFATGNEEIIKTSSNHHKALTDKTKSNHLKRLSQLRPKLIEGGVFFHRHHDAAMAAQCLETYIASSKAAAFAGTGRKDSLLGQAAYYASLLHFGEGNYAAADQDADLALDDEDYALDAAELKARCLKATIRTKTDSARYVQTLIALHDKAPSFKPFSRLLVEYFMAPGREAELKPFAMDEIVKHPESDTSWVLYGEMLMRESRWDDAINAYRKAVNLNFNVVEAHYNLGVCLSAKAQALKENPDSADVATANTLLDEAYLVLKRTRALDPDRKVVDWAKPLYQICRLTQRNVEAQEIRKLLKLK